MQAKKAQGVDQRQAAKERLVALMQTGYSWQEALTEAGLQMSRSAVYRLLQAVRTRGKAAIRDGRHGHPAKLREPVSTFLETLCCEQPDMPSRVAQAALQARFGIEVSVGHLNRVRARLNSGRCTISRKKNLFLVQQRNPIGRKELVDSFCSQPHRKRVCFPD